MRPNSRRSRKSRNLSRSRKKKKQRQKNRLCWQNSVNIRKRRQDLAEELENSLETDIRAGFTTTGPHRDDFLLLIGTLDAAEFASEGQQRTLAIALQMAQSALLQEETGKSPILLIDDIFGELDTARRRALLAMLPAESQVFITTTNLDWLGDMQLPLPIIKVQHSSINSNNRD